MKSGVFTNGKLLFCGIICLLVVTVVSYLWHNNSVAPYKKEVIETSELVRKTEEATSEPAESTPTAAEKPITTTIDRSAHIETDDVEAEDSLTESDIAGEVPVSPFGLGPFPALPDDPSWSDFNWNSCQVIEHELINRVLVELWNQGIQADGGAMRNGLVYPTIRGVRYVEWTTFVKPSGESVRYISRSTGHPDDGKRLRDIRNAKRNSTAEPSVRNVLTKDDIPSDIKLVSAKDEGINPYTFLDLP